MGAATLALTWPARIGAAWDDGIRWFTRRTVDPSDSPVTLAYVRDQVLRVANNTAEDTHITALIAAAVDAWEDQTQRAGMPQTWQWVASGFPRGLIVLPRPPLISVESIAYIDTDGETQILSGSPAQFEVVNSGKTAKAQIRPFYGESWPATRCQSDAVTVTFHAGYADASKVPALDKQGLCVHIAEQYKQRSLSIANLSVSALAPLQLPNFWKRVW